MDALGGIYSIQTYIYWKWVGFWMHVQLRIIYLVSPDTLLRSALDMNMVKLFCSKVLNVKAEKHQNLSWCDQFFVKSSKFMNKFHKFHKKKLTFDSREDKQCQRRRHFRASVSCYRLSLKGWLHNLTHQYTSYWYSWG